MTYLTAPISGEDADEVGAGVREAIEAGAEAIELRVDEIARLSPEDLRRLREAAPREIPFILTIRGTEEGGQWDGGDDERVSRLIEFGPFVEFIDVELALWRRSANIRQKVDLALKRAGHVSQDGGREEFEFGQKRRLILSKHDLRGRPDTLNTDLMAMLREPTCAAAKIAWRARTVRDNFEALELTRECPRPGIFICMGADGLASRVLAKKFGALVSFAAPRADRASALGQATLAEMTSLYRWGAIDRSTRVYGVIGDPIGHSLSPHVHNAAFEATKTNAVYLPFRVAAGYESFKAFMVEALARPWLDVRGWSVTLPHKENALRFLKERGSELDADCAATGAVNTIRVDEGGALRGLNTDCAAVGACIKQLLGDEPGAGRAAVLGAGGVARAVVWALSRLGLTVTVFNRTPARGLALAAAFGCAVEPWEKRNKEPSTLIVNCTSIGMWPDTERSPLSEAALKNRPAVLDTIYRPAETMLIQQARGRGCRVLGGMEMFIHQAGRQFEVWTGLTAPDQVMSAAAAKAAMG